jgi:hypothetical protein
MWKCHLKAKKRSGNGQKIMIVGGGVSKLKRGFQLATPLIGNRSSSSHVFSKTRTSRLVSKIKMILF